MKLIARIGAMIFIMACVGGDGGKPTVAPLSPEGARHANQAYSPDGSKVAYWVRAVGGWQLWVANADLTNPVNLSVLGGTNTPVWSPDGSLIAVNSSDFGLVHTVVVPASGGAAKRVTKGNGIDVPIEWFPDGDHLAVVNTEGGTFVAFVTSVSTGEMRRLVPGETRPHVATPSPDGKRIGYMVIDGSKTTLWMADSAGGNARQLTTEGFEGQSYNDMSWSPDSREIMYESRRTGTTDLWVVPVDGGPARQLTRDVRNDFSAVWSGDGKWIGFISDRGRQTDVWAVPAAGGQEVRITDTPEVESSVRWRPGTSELSFVNLTRATGTWAIDVANGTERKLTPDSLILNTAAISPSGADVSYVIDHGGGVQDLAVGPIGGGPLKTIVAGGGTVDRPRWSPDGSKIVFGSDRGGTQDVWVVDVAGGAPRQLENWPGYEQSPAWNADGSSVYFVSDRDSKLGDVWKVAVGGGEPQRVTTNGTVNGNLRSGNGVFYAGTINAAGGQIGISRIGTDGRINPVWDRTNAGIQSISPTGDAVAAGVEQADGSGRTMIIPGSGGAGRVILDKNESAYGWSADGKSLLYIFDVDGSTDLGILSLTDGSKRRLTTTPAYEVDAEFSPDGKTVLLGRVTVANRLYKAVVR